MNALVAVDESGENRERPIVVGVRSTNAVDFNTGKEIAPVQKCHLNAGVFDTRQFEQQAAFILDTTPAVDRWVKNERLGFTIPYRREGVLRRYFPDFLVVLTNGQRLIVETKGKDAADVVLKEKAALRWCQAVNNDGRFGHWSYRLVWEAGELQKVLSRVSADRPLRPASLAADALKEAESEVERLRAEGWDRKRFADELESFLVGKKSS